MGFCRARRDVDQRALQSDVPWCGWDHRRTELSSPSLLELPLKVKWDYAHSRSSRSGSPQHSQANAPRGLKVPGTAWAASQNLRLWGAISETKRALKRLQLKHTSSLQHVPTVEGCVRCGSVDRACGKLGAGPPGAVNPQRENTELRIRSDRREVAANSQPST